MNKQKLINIFEKQTPLMPMTLDETKAVMTIMMSDNDIFTTDIDEIDKENEIFKHFKPLIDAFQVQVFMSRIKNTTTLKITLGALIMLME